MPEPLRPAHLVRVKSVPARADDCLVRSLRPGESAGRVGEDRLIREQVFGIRSFFAGFERVGAPGGAFGPGRPGGGCVSLNEGIPQLVVYQEEYDALRAILSRVHADAQARAVLLMDLAGQLVAEWGDTGGLDLLSFCSLAASNIAATGAMAQMLGEKDFTILFHQGEKDSIHITLVANQVILVVIFGSEATLGLVRLRVRKAAEDIHAVVDRIIGRMNVADRLDLDPMCEITERDIDDLFSF